MVAPTAVWYPRSCATSDSNTGPEFHERARRPACPAGTTRIIRGAPAPGAGASSRSELHLTGTATEGQAGAACTAVNDLDDLYSPICRLLDSDIQPGVFVSRRRIAPLERSVYSTRLGCNSANIGHACHLGTFRRVLSAATIAPFARCREVTRAETILLLIAAFAVCSLWSAVPATAAFRVLQLLAATLLIWYLVCCWGPQGSADAL